MRIDICHYYKSDHRPDSGYGRYFNHVYNKSCFYELIC